MNKQALIWPASASTVFYVYITFAFCREMIHWRFTELLFFFSLIFLYYSFFKAYGVYLAAGTFFFFFLTY